MTKSLRRFQWILPTLLTIDFTIICMRNLLTRLRLVHKQWPLFVFGETTGLGKVSPFQSFAFSSP